MDNTEAEFEDMDWIHLIFCFVLFHFGLLSGRLMWKWTFGYHKRWWISWL